MLRMCQVDHTIPYQESCLSQGQRSTWNGRFSPPLWYYANQIQVFALVHAHAINWLNLLTVSLNRIVVKLWSNFLVKCRISGRILNKQFSMDINTDHFQLRSITFAFWLLFFCLLWVSISYPLWVHFHFIHFIIIYPIRLLL